MQSSTLWLLPVLVLATAFSAGTSQEVLGSANSVCSGVSFGILPHPTECQLYYVCVNSQGSVHRCGYNFVFDPRVSFCVHRTMYRCPNEEEPSSPAPTEPPKTTTAPESPSTPSDCPETSWEAHFCWNHVSVLIRNPINCTQFIDCELEPPRNQDCPPGRVFSLPYQDCFPGDERTCRLEPVETSFCAARPSGNYPHPYQCNRFVTCFQGSPRVESCPPYYVFDQETLRCVRGDVVQCSSLLPVE